jgi:hypothetical protein
MSRIPTHTVEDAPAASRPLLQKIVEATPMGRPALLHGRKFKESLRLFADILLKENENARARKPTNSPP